MTEREFDRVLVTSLDPFPPIPASRTWFSTAITVKNRPGYTLLLLVNKNKRGSERAWHFPNAKIPGAYDIFIFDGVSELKHLSGPFDTPLEASEAMEAVAPCLGPIRKELPHAQVPDSGS